MRSLRTLTFWRFFCRPVDLYSPHTRRVGLQELAAEIRYAADCVIAKSCSIRLKIMKIEKIVTYVRTYVSVVVPFLYFLYCTVNQSKPWNAIITKHLIEGSGSLRSTVIVKLSTQTEQLQLYHKGYNMHSLLHGDIHKFWMASPLRQLQSTWYCVLVVVCLLAL